jgi:hypothetical protein
LDVSVDGLVFGQRVAGIEVRGAYDAAPSGECSSRAVTTPVSSSALVDGGIGKGNQ